MARWYQEKKTIRNSDLFVFLSSDSSAILPTSISLCFRRTSRANFAATASKQCPIVSTVIWRRRFMENAPSAAENGGCRLSATNCRWPVSCCCAAAAARTSVSNFRHWTGPTANSAPAGVPRLQPAKSAFLSLWCRRWWNAADGRQSAAPSAPISTVGAATTSGLCSATQCSQPVTTTTGH